MKNSEVGSVLTEFELVPCSQHRNTFKKGGKAISSTEKSLKSHLGREKEKNSTKKGEIDNSKLRAFKII